jgi:DNA-binding transcriptional regulator YiaG
MSIIFNANAAKTGADKRAMTQQWNYLQGMRAPGNPGVAELLQLAGNASATPSDAYKEFDGGTTKIEPNPLGEFSTLTMALQFSKSVSLGRSAYEFRKSSRAGSAKTSLSPDVGLVTDKVDYKYQGTVIPFHQVGYGREWQEVMQGRAEAFDALTDDAREADLNVLRKVNDYMWNGNEGVSVKGFTWLGLRLDPSVAQETLGADLSSEATAYETAFSEVKRLRDVLRITNNVSGGIKLAVSREIMSNWENLVDTSNGSNIKLLKRIEELRGIEEVYEDPELVGNELAMFYMGTDGFHPVTSMAMASFALPRDLPISDYNFMKIAGVGFMSKTSYEGKTCALFAS